MQLKWYNQTNQAWLLVRLEETDRRCLLPRVRNREASGGHLQIRITIVQRFPRKIKFSQCAQQATATT